MTDEIEKEEEYTLTAEYVLGLLTEEEAAAYEEVLGVDPALREEYAFWADRIAALTDEIAPVTPPPHVLAQIKTQLFHDAATKAAGKGGSWLQRLGLLPAMGAGLAAALVVLWLFNVALPPADGPAVPTYTAQIAAEDNSLVLQASYDGATQTLTVTRQTGAVQPGRAQELWLIAGDSPPVSLGLLQQDASTDLTVDTALVPALPGGTLAITDEPPGGAPQGVATGAVLATGQITDT